MLEIAGGILIAVAVLAVVVCFWDTLLAGAFIVIGLAIIAGVWVFLASVFESGWGATAAIVGAGAGLWGFWTIQASEWNERRIREAAERKKISPFSLSDSISISLILTVFFAFFTSLITLIFTEYMIIGEKYAILFSLIFSCIFFISFSFWHHNRFVKNFRNKDYEKSNLSLVALAQALAVGFISMVFIPVIMVAVVSGVVGSINSNWGESGAVLGTAGMLGLVSCAMIARGTYRGAIQKGLPGAGEN